MDDIIDADETDEWGREERDSEERGSEGRGSEKRGSEKRGSEKRGSEELERYRTINYLDGDETVTIIQERENDDAWIQSDLTFDIRT